MTLCKNIEGKGVTSIFSFSYNIFNFIKTKFIILSTFISSSANAFNLDSSKSLTFGKELSLFNTILTIIDPKKEAFENIVGKGENAGNQHFSVSQTILVLFMIMLLSVNPFPNKPWFLRVCSTSLLKTLWEKEKLLVTNNLSFSQRVFYPFGELTFFIIKFAIVVCNLFQIGRV